MFVQIRDGQVDLIIRKIEIWTESVLDTDMEVAKQLTFDDPDWGINWNYLSVEIYLNKDNHIILHQDGYSYSDRHSVDVFNAMDENKRTAIIYEHFVAAYPEFIKNFERIAENEIQKKEMSLENVELPVLHSEKDILEDVLSTFETYCIKDGISYAMNETKDELYAINSSLSDHDINTLLKSAINKHEFDAGDQVYLYADDDELHYHLEELFDQYLDAPDDFDFVSEEFESGLEQYQDEIGKNEMELQLRQFALTIFIRKENGIWLVF